MFRCDRFVKCRTRSISAISGNGGGLTASADLGSRCSVGTSELGKKWQRRPGWLSSKSSSVDCVLIMDELKGVCRAGSNVKHRMLHRRVVGHPRCERRGQSI